MGELFNGLRIVFVDGSSHSPENFIFQYQALIAGVLALVVGVASIAVLQKQIIEERARRKHEDERRHRAIKAGLTFAFIELMNYSEECWKFTTAWLSNWDEFKNWDKQSALGFVRDSPDLPFDSIRNIQQAIETAPELVAQKLEELLTFVQVQHSSMSAAIHQTSPKSMDSSWVIHKNNLYKYAHDCLELYFRASRGLWYARGSTKMIEALPDFSAVEEFLFFVSPSIEDELREYLDQSWGNFYEPIDLSSKP